MKGLYVVMVFGFALALALTIPLWLALGTVVLAVAKSFF